MHRTRQPAGLPIPIDSSICSFAGCPICNVDLQSIVRRHEEVPADFLIGPVLSRKRGRHANDQWTVDEVLAYAGNANA